MATVDLKLLVGKLNDLCCRSLESAAGHTLSLAQYNVELEHWLLKLLAIPDSDFQAILRRFEINQEKLEIDLNNAIGRLKSGNGRAPALSPDVLFLAKEAWVLASLRYEAPRIRSGHIICMLVNDDGLRARASELSRQFGRIRSDVLGAELQAITAGTAEDTEVEGGRPAAAPSHETILIAEAQAFAATAVRAMLAQCTEIVLTKLAQPSSPPAEGQINDTNAAETPESPTVAG